MEKRTFEVSHEGLGSRIERIYDHLPISWTSNFNPPVLETRGRGCANPRAFSANVSGLRWKIESSTVVELLLNRLPGFEDGLTSGLEGPVEGGQELEGIVSKDSGLSLRGNVGMDLDALYSHECSSVYDEMVVVSVETRGRETSTRAL